MEKYRFTPRDCD